MYTYAVAVHKLYVRVVPRTLLAMQLCGRRDGRYLRAISVDMKRFTSCNAHTHTHTHRQKC
jgi:hypothetical protein